MNIKVEEQYSDMDILGMFYLFRLEDLTQKEIDRIIDENFDGNIDVENNEHLERFLDLTDKYTK